MNAPVKLGIAAAGTVAASTSVYYGFGLNKSTEVTETTILSWTSLKKDTNLTSYDDKYAKKYARYLVGVEGNTNDDWWTWMFNGKYQEKKGELGSDGFANNTITDGAKLKEACQAVYGGTEETSGNEKKVSVPATEGGTDKKYKEEYVWRFCSPLGEKPKTISDLSEAGQYENLKAKDKANDLISVKSDKNNLFWEIRNKEFYEVDGFDKIAVEEADKYFWDERQKSGDKRKTIRKICETAYGLPSSEGTVGNDPTPDQIVKYCSVQ